MTTWDPDQYLRYASDRERPFWDLVARIPLADPARVVDLGCGPGTTTARLLERWPKATIHGIDNSAAMIEQANVKSVPARLSFEESDLADWHSEPASVDVIISNATLHWVPDHLELFARWLTALRPRGALAFQVPGNFGAASHTQIRALATSPAWRCKLAGATEVVDVRKPDDYYQQFASLGATVDLWETTYYHVLTGPDPVLEWVRGSALRPYLSRLSPEAAADFTTSYSRAMRQAYPPSPDGTTLFPFRRIFVIATLDD